MTTSSRGGSLGPNDDPGLWGSLGTRTPLGKLRKMVLSLFFGVTFVWVVAAFLTGPAISTQLALVAAGVALLAALAVPTAVKQATRQLATPLPKRTRPAEAAAQAAVTLRTSVVIGAVAALCPALVGLMLGVAMSAGLLPFAVGYVGSIVGLLLTIPRADAVERVRARLAEDGAKVPVWDLLLTPVQERRPA